MACRVFNADSQAIYAYNDNTNYDPYNPTSYSGTVLSSKNQLLLGIETSASTIEQTFELTAGWNWWSTNIEITLDDLKEALVAALPGTKIAIKSKDGSLTYNGRIWRGQLSSLDVTQMYKIGVITDCEITLEGEPINPAEHPITMSHGYNGIGFPFTESMTLQSAFGSFPVAGDVIKSNGNGSAKFNGTRWRGTLTTLEPGQGYLYLSTTSGDRIFTYPANAK